MLAHSNSITLLQWRGATVRLFPLPARAFVYLIHFSQPIGCSVKKNGVKHYAAHYVGSCICLDRRMQEHLNGDGARILAHCNEIGVSWHVERLWTFDRSEDARAFEKKLKRASHGPRYCPACNPKLASDLRAQLRRGHHPMLSKPQGKRRPMGERQPVFVRRESR